MKPQPNAAMPRRTAGRAAIASNQRRSRGSRDQSSLAS